MRISVQPQGEKVTLHFSGKDDVTHEIIITKDDAQQLRELLTQEEGGFFETDQHRPRQPKP